MIIFTLKNNKMPCVICLDANSTTFYTCPYCRNEVCKECLKDMIVSYPEIEAHCPKCDSLIPIQYVSQAFGIRDFRKIYITQLTNSQLKLQEQFIPMLLEKIELVKNNIKLLPETKEDKAELKKLHYILFHHGFRTFDDLVLAKNIPRKVSTTDIVNWNTLVEKYQIETQEQLYYNIDINVILDRHQDKVQIKKYLFKCPTENCSGLLEDNYTCKLCKKTFCSKCLSELNENHQCKKEDVESLGEIKKSTRPCPKCGARIFRSEGCAQMFCTNCHTGFDWNTGKIITSNFHNPHRIEWLQQINSGVNIHNEEQIGECGELPDNPLLINNVLIRHYAASANHYRDVIADLQRKMDNVLSLNNSNNSTKYILYLSGLMDEKKYYSYLKQNVIKYKKYQFCIRILQDYVDSITDVVANFINTVKSFNFKLTDIMGAMISVLFNTRKNPYHDKKYHEEIDLLRNENIKENTHKFFTVYENTLKMCAQIVDKSNEDFKLLTECFGLNYDRQIKGHHMERFVNFGYEEIEI